MTPWPVAKFMASLFSYNHSKIHLLDAGAGVGSLTAAFVEDWSVASPKGAALSVQTFEIDDTLAGELCQTLALCEIHATSTKRQLHYLIARQDYIKAATSDLLPLSGRKPSYTHTILNPPYAKINTGSAHRRLLSDIGIETVNLYTGFVALAVAQLQTNGELVAIIPRSWCNGPYYRPFRRWMQDHAALEHIHLFESRKKAFKDDAVLQENVIVRWRRGSKQGAVTVSTSSDATFKDYAEFFHPFESVVHPKDKEIFIHIPTKGETVCSSVSLPKASLHSIGVELSTGPVVDFRLKDHLRANPTSSTVPLLYAQHFRSGALAYPVSSKKPNAIELNDATRKWLYQKGWYVITKRFTSKEETRRVVAHIVDPNALPSDFIGFENHLNVFHANRTGLDPDLAYGLALYLNSSMVDEYFRVFSGHTQVNATDLRRMTYPAKLKLISLGKWSRKQRNLTQAEIDSYLKKHL